VKSNCLTDALRFEYVLKVGYEFRGEMGEEGETGAEV
jgi:hypothetical protein